MTTMTTTTKRTIRPADTTSTEWEARIQLAACYRIFAHLGWTELIYNHITLRLAGFGQALPHQSVRTAATRRCSASNLVKIDSCGQCRRATPTGR